MRVGCVGCTQAVKAAFKRDLEWVLRPVMCKLPQYLSGKSVCLVGLSWLSPLPHSIAWLLASTRCLRFLLVLYHGAGKTSELCRSCHTTLCALPWRSKRLHCEKFACSGTFCIFRLLTILTLSTQQALLSMLQTSTLQKLSEVFQAQQATPSLSPLSVAAWRFSYMY